MASTTLTGDDRYRAILAKDRRFDGQFITAVGSTGIYCRPSCPARTPKRENVTFYPTSAAAHEAGYRACKRCLPDAAPGDPAWNVRGDVAGRAMRLIADGVVEREGVPGLAARLGYSTRHLGRVLTAELGAGPLALARAQRARTAATLLGATELPLADVAFAAGFASVRQFNETVQGVFQLTPTQVRERSRGRASTARLAGGAGGGSSAWSPGSPSGSCGAGVGDVAGDGQMFGVSGVPLTLALAYREPYDAAGVFTWLGERAIDGVEVATADSYERSLFLPGGPAWFGVDARGAQPSSLRLRTQLTDLSDLQTLVTRVRRLFDLDADPSAIDGALSVHPGIAERVRLRPGRRLPGAVDSDEMLFRAIIGQQITVSAARTALNRLTLLAGASLAGDGEPVPARRVSRLFPRASAIAELGDDSFAGPRARAATITSVAEAIADGRLRLSPGDDIGEQHSALTAFKGIGDWTAGYVSMRVLGNPDVLLTGDVALRSGAEALGLPSDPKALTAVAEQFRPWRSYLSLHLWGATPPRTRSGTKKPTKAGLAAQPAATTAVESGAPQSSSQTAPRAKPLSTETPS